jgi:hypothetical protein
MAALSFNITGLDTTLKGIDTRLKGIEQDLQDELNAWAELCTTEAKIRAPKDEGHLVGAINPKFGKLTASTTVAVNYAAFPEFGTRKMAAAYVATLPADWQTYAAQFKGGGGSFGNFFETILAWVKRKGIEPAAAYPIAIKILRDGIKPHPYLFPAYEHTIKDLKANLKTLFK